MVCGLWFGVWGFRFVDLNLKEEKDMRSAIVRARTAMWVLLLLLLLLLLLERGHHDRLRDQSRRV